MTTFIFKNENERRAGMAALIEAGVVELGRGAAQDRQLQIIEGAIKSYVVDGIHKANFSTIAAACNVTRPLVQHYFSTPENLFSCAVRYVRFLFRSSVLASVEKAKEPKTQLKAYVQSCFEWVEKYPLHAQFWLLFLFHCGSESSHRVQNTEFVDMGALTIENILKAGVRERQFAVSKPSNAARRIQRIIAGGMLTVGTENIPVAEVAKDTLDHCNLLVKRI